MCFVRDSFCYVLSVGMLAYIYIYSGSIEETEKEKRRNQLKRSMTSTATFLVQIASVPGNQVGQRKFEQTRYLHELLVNTLVNRNEQSNTKQQITAITKLVPEHEIVLRSGFSQTAQWGLEPNMFVEVS